MKVAVNDQTYVTTIILDVDELQAFASEILRLTDGQYPDDPDRLRRECPTIETIIMFSLETMEKVIGTRILEYLNQNLAKPKKGP